MRLAALALLVLASCDVVPEGDAGVTACTCGPPGGLLVVAQGCGAEARPNVTIAGRQVEPGQERCLGTASWLYTWPGWASSGMQGRVRVSGSAGDAGLAGEATFFVNRSTCVHAAVTCAISGR